MDQMRASDHDRQKVVGILREHYAQGRLDAAELEERTRAALTAKTHGDLQALTQDLPSDSPPDSPSRILSDDLPRPFLKWLAVAAIPAALIALILLGTGFYELASHGVHGVAHVTHGVGRIIHDLTHFAHHNRHFH